MGKRHESGVKPELDLDKTDELPVLDVAAYESSLKETRAVSDTDRLPQVDLPALIDSVQNAEARIAQQNIQYEILEREMAQLRHQGEESAREAQRLSEEAQALRQNVSSRDEMLAQSIHSLSERDVELADVWREHAALTQSLEERGIALAHLQLEGSDTRSQVSSMRGQLHTANETVATLTAQVRRDEGAIAAMQRQIDGLKGHATAYLETLRSREWRRGNGEDIARELDAQLACAQAATLALEQRSAEMAATIEALTAKISDHEATIHSLEVDKASALEAQKAAHREVKDADKARKDLLNQIASKDSGHAELLAKQVKLTESLQARERTLNEEREAHAALKSKVQTLETAQGRQTARITELETVLADAEREKGGLAQQVGVGSEALSAAQALAAQHSQQIEELKNQRMAAESRIAKLEQTVADANRELADRDSALLESAAAQAAASADAQTQLGKARSLESSLVEVTAQLNEARRPINEADAEIKRLTAVIAEKNLELESAQTDSRKLQSSLERARGALEEREFLIRRLERSANNSAQVLGRLQTSIERLGSPSEAQAPEPPPMVDHIAVLTRLDGAGGAVHTLGAKTRIGRSPDCEIRIDSTSVSRHHAIILTGARHVIVEDLNSTNGVAVNGRKVMRHKLNDGDTLTIGEAKFKFSDTVVAQPKA